MKQRILLAIIAGIFSSVVGAQAQNSAKIVNGPAFKKLNVIGPVSVEVIEAPESSVKVEGNHEFINSIAINWMQDELYITFTGSVNPRNPSVKVYVSDLNYIYADNGARISTPEPLVKTQNLKLSVRDEESLARILSFGKVKVADYGDVRVRTISKKQ